MPRWTGLNYFTGGLLDSLLISRKATSAAHENLGIAYRVPGLRRRSLSNVMPRCC